MQLLLYYKGDSVCCLEKHLMLFIFTAHKIYFEKQQLFGVLYKSTRNSGLCIITCSQLVWRGKWRWHSKCWCSLDCYFIVNVKLWWFRNRACTPEFLHFLNPKLNTNFFSLPAVKLDVTKLDAHQNHETELHKTKC